MFTNVYLCIKKWSFHQKKRAKKVRGKYIQSTTHFSHHIKTREGDRIFSLVGAKNTNKNENKIVQLAFNLSLNWVSQNPMFHVPNPSQYCLNEHSHRSIIGSFSGSLSVAKHAPQWIKSPKKCKSRMSNYLPICF